MKDSTQYTVYVLLTSGGTFYTGITNNLEQRLKKHKNGTGAKYLQMFESFELVYEEEVENKSKALQREYEIKQMKKEEKEVLVANI